MPNTPVGLTSDLLRRRPDMLQAEQTMIGANAEIGVAVAKLLSPHRIVRSLRRPEPEHRRRFRIKFQHLEHRRRTCGPLFQGGRLIETYYAQQAFWNGTIAQYQQTILVAFQEVSDALIAQQTLVDQRAALTLRWVP